jgi:hypothetical protein
VIDIDRGHRGVPAFTALSDRAKRMEETQNQGGPIMESSSRLERFRKAHRSAQAKRVEKTGKEFRGLRELREEFEPEPAFVEEPAQPVEVVRPIPVLRWVLCAILFALLLTLGILL